MGLEDRESMRILRGALDLDRGSEVAIGEFYTRWFAADLSARDLFPPDMHKQRQVFAQALCWLCDELIAQRAEEPVAFLAQLGRDHRKYGVTQQHYDTLKEALLAMLRARLAERWDRRLAEAVEDVVALVVGVMSGAADAETSPPFSDGTVVEHLRPGRDVSVIRLRMDHPLSYAPGQYVPVQVPQWPRRWRYLSPSIPADPQGYVEFHVRSVPGGMVSTAIVGETRPGDRWRLSNPHGALHVDRDAGDVLMVAGQHRAGSAAGADHGPGPVRREPAGAPVLRRQVPLRAVRPAHAVGDRVDQPVAVGDPGVGVRLRPAVGRAVSRRHAAPRTARPADGQACRRSSRDTAAGATGRSCCAAGRRWLLPPRRHCWPRARPPSESGTTRWRAEPCVAGSVAMDEFETVTLRDPSSALTATYVPGAGMVGTSLSDDGVELLGQRRGLQAYVSNHKTMGIPILYPWANRLSSMGYGVDGAVVTLTPGHGRGAHRPARRADPRHVGRLPGLDRHDDAGVAAHRRTGLRGPARAAGHVPVPAPADAGHHAGRPHADRDHHRHRDDGFPACRCVSASIPTCSCRVRRGRSGASRPRPCATSR